MKMRTIVSILLFAVGNAHAASNLLQNPGFDTGIEPEWGIDFSGVGVEFSTVDEFDSELSGSARFFDIGEFGRVIDQCIHVGETVMVAGYSYRVPSEVTVPFAPLLFVNFYPTGDCQGSILDGGSVLATGPIQGMWAQEAIMFATPPGTQSVSFGITFPGSGSSDAEVFIDNASLWEIPLFFDGFED